MAYTWPSNDLWPPPYESTLTLSVSSLLRVRFKFLSTILTLTKRWYKRWNTCKIYKSEGFIDAEVMPYTGSWAWILLRFRDVLGHIYSWHGGKGEAFWVYFSQKISQEPRSYSRTRCFSLYVETQNLGSGLWFTEIIIFKIYTVITSRLLPCKRHLILLWNCFSAQQKGEICMLIENQGPECRISCNYGNLVNFASW